MPMQVVTNENTVFCDVDGTLICHDIHDTAATYVYIQDTISDGQLKIAVNLPMLRLVLEEISRGKQVVIWSRGGSQWARNVCEALKLDIHPIIVMAKPLVYFDDLDVSHWLKDRVFLSSDTRYKDNK